MAFALTFVLGLGTGAALVVNENDGFGTAANITAVLKADSDLYSQVEIQSRTLGSTKALTSYAAGMQRIDTSACPSDFREAFFRHAKAWEAYVQELQAKSDAESNSLAGLLAALFTGDGGLAMSAMEPLLAADPTSAAITATWTEVQALAIRHGVVFRN